VRQDPDVIMVGEIRDRETADIAIRAALTGHLVFSTLHTNDAAGGVARLLEMGIEPYLVTSSVLGFIAQRLVRVLCAHCQEPAAPSPELRHQFGVADLPPAAMRSRGCDACKHTGFQGRTAIYEFLVVDEQIQQMILRRGSAREISRLAQQAGMRTMRQDGWLKILAGITTPQEVLRVT
jgi:general secretion pathway protein E